MLWKLAEMLQRPPTYMLYTAFCCFIRKCSIVKHPCISQQGSRLYDLLGLILLLHLRFYDLFTWKINSNFTELIKFNMSFENHLTDGFKDMDEYYYHMIIGQQQSGSNGANGRTE